MRLRPLVLVGLSLAALGAEPGHAQEAGEERPPRTSSETPAETPADAPDAQASHDREESPTAPPAEPDPPTAQDAPAPPPLRDALLLEAGRAVPPGLTSGRSAERRAERAAVLAELEPGFAPGDPRRESWLARVETVLADLDGRFASEELWLATARVAGALGLTEVDAVLARALAPTAEEASPRRALAARLALRAMYGPWFAAEKEFLAFRAELGEGAVSAGLLERLRELEAENRAQRIRLLAHEPERALADLADRDPRVRAAAASELGDLAGRDLAGRDLAGRDLERTEVEEALLARLEVEVAPEAVHALFASLDRLAADPSVPLEQGAELRARLLDEVRARVEADQPGVELTLAQALARLPYGTDADGTRRLALALDLVARLLRRLALAAGAADEDVLVGVVDALNGLHGLAGATPGVDAEALRRARLPVLDLLREAAWSDEVRLAAARAASQMALQRDAAVLVQVLEASSTSTELAFALLGGLRSVAEGLDPGGAAAARVVDAVLARAGDDDADVRRQALAFLEDEAARPLLEGRDLSSLAARLGAEPVDELLSRVLQLVGAYGDEGVVETILELPRFDAVATGDPALAGELTRTLEHLATGSAARSMRVARRLVDVEGESTGLSLVWEALRIVADLGPGDLAELEPADHAAVVDWAMAARLEGFPLDTVAEEEGGFLRRLVDVHLPLSRPGAEAEPSPLEEVRFHHRRALLLGDLAAGGGAPTGEGGGPSADSIEEVLEHFAAALERAEAAGEAGAEDLVPRLRRDRARFLRRSGRSADALAEYRRCLATDEGRAPGEGTGPAGVLELSDLRAFGRLVAGEAQASGADGAEARALEAYRIASELVHRPSWRLEPEAVRLADLADLVERAVASNDRDALAAVAADLGEPGAAPKSPIPLWDGLTADPDGNAELQHLRATLTRALNPPADDPLPVAAPTGTLDPPKPPADQRPAGR